MATFDINTNDVIKLTNKLDELHRSALPSAVRNTLNNAAFEMKKNIPFQADKKFITRDKGFFKRMSAVNKASGFDINRMVAETGIISKDKKLAKNLVNPTVSHLACVSIQGAPEVNPQTAPSTAVPVG